eukprot:TRINITY_DN10567_c0_g2_i1.p1 TRINITY_DN10567_c0_g2~~TRINITY_DN10567_c0_g2_i1.p1  ORF type:complete len:187 (+),score=35.31 TRINITY_DN10567_c0_g2_i1:87-647(+)
MLLATQGTIDGGCIALEKGWAINLAGGYHHASSKFGNAFNIYPDISLCIKHLKEFHHDIVESILIIDLDCHQGNGYETDFAGDDEVFIIDFYDHEIFPADDLSKKTIDVDVRIWETIKENEYLQKLEEVLPQSFQEFQPSFVIYIAGQSIANRILSQDFVIQRDEFIFSSCLKKKYSNINVEWWKL